MIIEQEVTMPNAGQDVNVKQKVDSGQSLGCTPTSSTPNASPTQSDAEKEFELEKQLHEQYAINNNAKAGHLIALFAAVAAVIGSYGYYFIHCISAPCCYVIEGDKFSLDVLLWVTVACYFTIVSLYYISYYLGVYQRMDQFIAFSIRCQYYSKECGNYKKVFPKGYCPYFKKGKDIPIGIFGHFCLILKILFVLISLTTAIRTLLAYSEIESLGIRIWVALCGCSMLLSIGLFLCIDQTQNDRYEKRQKEYLKERIICPLSEQEIEESHCSKCCYNNC